MKIEELFWPLVATVFFLDGFDYGFTRVAVSTGVGVEVDPFAAPILLTAALSDHRDRSVPLPETAR
jgi:hypothetical protein